MADRRGRIDAVPAPGARIRGKIRGYPPTTLRAAELVGLDAGQVLAGAVGERDLAEPATSRRHRRRIRRRTGTLVPLPAPSWSTKSPASPTPNAGRMQIAALMDARRNESASTPPAAPPRGRSVHSARSLPIP